MSKEIAGQVVEAVRDAAPPVTVVGMTVYGVSLPDIVSIATLVYLVLQAAYIINKWQKGR